MDGIQIAVETLKFFEQNKDAIAGMTGAGALLSSTAKSSIYLVQKGAKMVSYLITRAKKKPAKSAAKALRSRKPASRSGGEALVTKKDVAIIIDINRRSLTQVAEYLESKKVDADFIVITNDPTYGEQVKFLNPKSPKEWEALLKDFALHMTRIQRTVGSARVHIFQSTPVALAFSLGCVWGTVHPGAVYHYEDGTYHRVLDVKRSWKQG